MTHSDPSASKMVSQQTEALEEQIAVLTTELEEAKCTVQEWIDASADLTVSAQQARAATQSRGRGLGGTLLGSKYRAASRRLAATENAQIARDVAEKRAAIKEGKKIAQEEARLIQAQINSLKKELKDLRAQQKPKASTQSSQSSKNSLVLLEKLKEAYDMGLLTPEEYEEKRKKLVDQI